MLKINHEAFRYPFPTLSITHLQQLPQIIVMSELCRAAHAGVEMHYIVNTKCEFL